MEIDKGIFILLLLFMYFLGFMTLFILNWVMDYRQTGGKDHCYIKEIKLDKGER